MPATSRWCGRQNGGRGAWWCQSSLIRRSSRPTEDFGSYPRRFAGDIAALKAEKVDLVWAPSPEAMYPEGFATRIAPEGAALAGLEDKFRPHFFGGVATVVAKLFTQVAPDFAMFGEKDYQQLRVVTQMAKDLDLPVKVVGVPTVREADGLALSSRNVYLTETERERAPTLYRVLKASAADIKAGGDLDRVLVAGRGIIELAGFALDYLEARHAADARADQGTQRGRPDPAAGCGKARQDAADRQYRGLEQPQFAQFAPHGLGHARRAGRGAGEIARRILLFQIAPALEGRAWPRLDQHQFAVEHHAATADPVLVGEGADIEDFLPAGDLPADHPIERAAGRELRRPAWAPCGWCGYVPRGWRRRFFSFSFCWIQSSRSATESQPTQSFMRCNGMVTFEA